MAYQWNQTGLYEVPGPSSGLSGVGPPGQTTIQLSPVDANAGNQSTLNQNVSVYSPSTSAFSLGGGAQTPTGGTVAPAIAGAAGSPATTWTTWMLILILAYFGYKYLG
jgi:hypothetical protein